MLIKQNLSLFNSVLNEGKSAIPSLLNGLEMLFFASEKAKLFPKNFFFDFPS